MKARNITGLAVAIAVLFAPAVLSAQDAAPVDLGNPFVDQLTQPAEPVGQSPAAAGMPLLPGKRCLKAPDANNA